LVWCPRNSILSDVKARFRHSPSNWISGSVMMRINLAIGDCFAIPLTNGRYAYGRIVFYDGRHDGLGYLIEIYDLISDHIVDIQQLENAKQLFPPIFVGIIYPIKIKRWIVIGNLPVRNFKFPLFRDTLGIKPGIYSDWEIWDGSKRIRVGRLPKQYKSLELLYGWSYDLVEERIETGHHPFEGLE